METFIDVFPTLAKLNEYKTELFPSIEDTNQEEYVSLVGRYASSHIRYMNRYQFMCAFFTILREAQEKLRIKLTINTRLRSLEESEALEGEQVITNDATNPDTEPSTNDYSPLPYVNKQVAQKGDLSKVKGLYNWKHSVGGQAYNEFLDAFKSLFKVILIQEETVYEQ